MEDEIQFLMTCTALEVAIERFIDPIVDTNGNKDSMGNADNVSCLIEQAQIKKFGKALAGMYEYRHHLIYKNRSKPST